ncbi:MAG: NUDIX hydrolase [Candidatus Aenigmarchaeota archaeon]|nr:NUDIX hydrolase [Candidatus Aenigmarchaeota archaeon]
MKIRHDVQALLFDEINGEKKVFLIKFYDPTKKRDTWRLVKGGVEEGETDEQAMKREIMEEVTLKDVKVLDKVHDYEFDFKDTHHIVSTYLVKGNINETPKLNWDGDREIVESKWTLPSEALKLLFWKGEKDAVKLLKQTCSSRIFSSRFSAD